ncbi:MAG: BlaI/MecI/CopY family transcriptional regulator [Lachnospiraceae bacterium]|nr:BlaI/MecI/CopY family transcriptional regulator [Lachnospiraceae bacterium]
MKSQKQFNTNLTKRDLDVMHVLWDSEEPKTAAMIVKARPDLTMNTVQAVLRKLLNNNFIEVADIVYSGTVLSRSYRDAISQTEYTLQKMTCEYHSLKNKPSKASILKALLDAENDKKIVKQDIEEIRKFLEDYQN